MMDDADLVEEQIIGHGGLNKRVIRTYDTM